MNEPQQQTDQLHAEQPQAEPQPPQAEPQPQAVALEQGEPQMQMVDQPGKLLRIAMMVREMLEEVRRAPLDQDARKNLADVHERVLEELKAAMSGPLSDELSRITLAFDEVPTEAELRIAQAQLLGWLEGLFQGIQAAIATQQMQMASQLEEMRRRGLPAASRPDPNERPSGQYL